MYSVLLADDEPIIIRGLKKMIQWEKLNATIIGEAFDGDDTIQKVRKFKPDILVTDISMPGKTGIEILKTLKEEGVETKVIFLSAYREFSYAREAIEYGAVAYLLKPLDQEELEKTIIKAEEMLKQEHHINLPEQGAEATKQAGYPGSNRDSEYAEVYQQLKELEIEIQDKNFVGACFQIELRVDSGESMYELLKFSIFKRIQKHLRIQKKGVPIKQDDNLCNLILVLPRDNIQREVKGIIAETLEMVEKEYNVSAVAGIGDVINDLDSLKYAYRTARFAAELHYFEQQRVITYEHINKTYTRSIDDYNQEYQSLINCLFTHSQDYWLHLKAIIELIKDLHYGNKYAVVNRSVQFSMDLFKDLLDYHLVSEDNRSIYEYFIDELRKQTSYSGLRSVFLSFFKRFLKNIIENSNSKETDIVIRVKEYIKTNYAQDITLKQVAQVAYMNPYYFSSFFKKETGQNFKQYLTDIRMKEAIKLLMSSDMKTYAIAKAVGYNNVRHFNDKFKEIYGESPNSYKKSTKNVDDF